MKTKTKTKRTTQTASKIGKAHRSPSPSNSRKSVDNRDLNSDEQRKVTNVSAEEDTQDDDFQRLPVDDVEEEEERERKRRVEDARGEEEN